MAGRAVVRPADTLGPSSTRAASLDGWPFWNTLVDRSPNAARLVAKLVAQEVPSVGKRRPEIVCATSQRVTVGLAATLILTLALAACSSHSWEGVDSDAYACSGYFMPGTHLYDQCMQNYKDIEARRGDTRL